MQAAAVQVSSLDRARILKILDLWRSDLAPLEITPMTPDASLRRYFRVHLPSVNAAGDLPTSLLCMIFDSTKNPEHSGDCDVPADDAYVALTELYRLSDVKVPELYFDARSDGALLIEDIGDTHLKDIAFGKNAAESVLEPLYRDAIDTILRIQSIEARSAPAVSSFAFQRGFESRQFANEMLEFTDFYLAKNTAEQTHAAAMPLFPLLAKRLSLFEKTLVHRDFHSWNLLVDSKNEIRVIDFQDSLMASRCYDVIGLLNDRDTDSALGAHLYNSLLSYFFSLFNEDLRFEYYMGLLQRDLKVAGRFAKLSQERGLKQYEAWIPGTVRRIGETLEKLTSESYFWDTECVELRVALEAFLQALRVDNVVSR
jgi:hypothetical protein